MKASVHKVTSTGIDFLGQGTSGKPIRVYLFPSDGDYVSTLYNNDTGEKIQSLLNVERLLYFRLKSNQHLTIKCTTQGKMKVLL